jgi:hypothetical protein
MTKEEILAQMNILAKLIGDRRHLHVFEFTQDIVNELNMLQPQLKLAKSIQDLQREAFEAGRDNEHYEGPYKYEFFEDYLKSKEDE